MRTSTFLRSLYEKLIRSEKIKIEADENKYTVDIKYFLFLFFLLIYLIALDIYCVSFQTSSRTNSFLDGSFVQNLPVKWFRNNQLHAVLKLMNIEIGEHSSFFNNRINTCLSGP